MNVLVYDIETIPDINAGRRLYDLDGLSDEDIAQIMFNKRREKTGSEFLPVHLQQVVAISAVLRHGDSVKVWTLGELESTEGEIIQRFYDGIERYTPTLVSWNGSGFDLPVLHYRAMVNNIQAARYWDSGEDDREFKWNNYLNRFHSRHTDLMDVLAAYNPRAFVALDEVSVVLGFPGKLGMDGSKVWTAYLDGQLKSIRDYCETDVLNTYLIYLRWELTRGNLTKDQIDQEFDLLRTSLKAEKQQHLSEFLQAWDG